MRRSSTLPFTAAATIVLAACGVGSHGGVGPPAPDTVRVPLEELATRSYRGNQGGLYPDGQNEPPADHSAAGRAAAATITPLDASGKPSPSGKIVLLSVGMSNTTMEFCSGSYPACGSGSFAYQARMDADVNHTTLVLVDGARGGQAAPAWTSPDLPQYDSVEARLAAGGVTRFQVQAAWIKQADMHPTAALPAPNADAYVLEKELGDIVRALRVRYPNLRQVFLSSRIYGGYATTTLNPEPYAYEGAFPVKWLIASQIGQMRGTGAGGDPRAGDLAYPTAAPWLAWGPYLWAAGASARADGLVWLPQDFGTDGTHPQASARQKVGRMLLDFFKTSPFTRCWFVAGLQCS